VECAESAEVAEEIGEEKRKARGRQEEGKRKARGRQEEGKRKARGHELSCPYRREQMGRWG
jgi:hypothetical protein